MRILACLLLSCALLCAQDQTATVPGSLDGFWVGTLNAGTIQLRVAFHLSATGKNTFDSLDQGATGIPLSSVALKGTHVSMAAKGLNATYEAELLENGQRMQGVWSQGQPIPLALVRSSAIPENPRPQTPKPPFPYKQEDVTYPSVDKNVTLAGTLTIPEGAGPFPAVVMITGSGPQDRDSTMVGHKPFWVIADYLSRRGIAVLRTDDRGFGKSTGNFAASTTLSFADDAEGGVRFLTTRKDVSRIGLIGHSEGGTIAPIVADRNADVRFVVLLAGSAVSGDQILLEQNRRILLTMNLPESFADAQVERLRTILQAVRSDPDPKVGAEKARKALGTIDPALRSTVDAQIAQTTTPWFHWFISYDPGPALEKLKQPVLALTGSLDVQVPASQNIPVMKQKLKGNNNARVDEIPGLNHLFQHAKTGAPAQYSSIEETFAPEVLSRMADWISKLP